MNTKPDKVELSLRVIAVLVFLGIILLLFTGCGTVAVRDQGLLAKSSMQFSDSPISSLADRSIAMLEPGIASAGSGAATSCSSCR